MEAMILGYPPEQAGQISVTATKKEWQAVIEKLLAGFGESEGAPADLIHWLTNQGVYE